MPFQPPPHAAPRNDLEEKLGKIWMEVLNLERRDSEHEKVGIDDNFFELGGHSLKATSMVYQVYKELEINIEIEDVFNFPTIRELAQKVSGADESGYLEIEAAEEREYYELSYAQRRLWVLCQFEEDSTAYNMPAAIVLSGPIDVEAFNRAVQILAQRHGSLRTLFVTIAGEPYQRVLRDFTYNVEVADLRDLEPRAREEKTRGIYLESSNKAFDLETGPLFRFILVRQEDEKYVLVYNIHHIVNDGWSQGIITNEIITLYNHLRNLPGGDLGPVSLMDAAAGASLEPVKIQYKDYSRWHNGLSRAGSFSKSREYWLEKFSDKPNGIEMPLDHARKPIQTFNGGRVAFTIDKEKTARLQRLSLEDDATLFMSLLTLLSIFLYKYSGQKDIIVGAPIANRKRPELHHLIGFLVNTLIYRHQLEPGQNFRQLMAALKREALNCYEYQDFPFDLLVEELELDRDMSQSPLFNVMIAYNNAETEDARLSLDGITLSEYPHRGDFNMSKFDLIFFMDEIDNQVETRIEYNSDLFERSSVQRMADNFLNLVDRVLEDAQAPVYSLRFMGEAESRRVIRDFNDFQYQFPPLTLQELFEAQAEQKKDNAAVVFHDLRMSYRELNERANRLAHYLKEEFHIKTNDVVGVSMDRSLEMIVVLWGIIKSGAGYLAVDPTYPQDRVLHVLSDSEAELVIIDKMRPQLFGQYKGVLIDVIKEWDVISQRSAANPPALNRPEDVLYVNYTSGSTGTPNGAMLSHDCLTNLIKWQHTVSSIDCALKCLQFTSINFCVSFQEIMGTLTAGGELYLIGDVERQDIDYLMNYLGKYRIENLFLPFSYLNFLFNESGRWDLSFNHNLKHIITAGEQLKVTAGLKVFLDQNPHLLLHNHYGSTEMHVVTSYTLDASTAAQTPIPPAGKPISNIRIFLLDEHLMPVPQGVWGELCVAGSSEILGYIKNPELTDEKLISVPGLSDKRLYRSGDIGRWLENGNIELRGRKDFLVKIRGFRVEPGEIESKILAIPQVRECVVVVKEDAAGQKFLVGYVVVDGIDTAGIKRIIGNELPQYMIPTLILLDSLPLMPNGKVDRAKLPEPRLDKEEEGRGAPPETHVQAKLAHIWAGLLGTQAELIGIDDNFFERGGHSLKATTMMSHIHKELDVKVELVDIFKTPTIREIAYIIEGMEQEEFHAVEAVEKRDFYPASSAQQRVYLVQQLDPQTNGYNMPAVVILEGKLDFPRLQDAFRQLVKRHESFRTTFLMLEGKTYQRIHENVLLEIPYHEAVTSHDVRERVMAFVRPFDLTRSPLMRVEVIREEAHRHVLMVDMHHIISDGVSMGIVVAEFMNLYNGETLEPLALQYKDFSQWQNRFFASSQLSKQEEWWVEQFSQEIPVLQLPLDTRRPAIQGFDGRSIAFEIDAPRTAVLNRLAGQEEVTLFMVLLSLYSLFLSKLSGQEDIVVGTPIAGRRHADLEGIVGMFVNSLALRCRPNGEKTFREFLRDVKTTTLGAFDNQDFQYEELVEKVAVTRDTSRNPLFDTMLALQNTELPEIAIEGLTLKPYGGESRIAKFDLTLFCVEADEKLLCRLDYSTALFKHATVERFIRYFQSAVTAVVDNPHSRLSGIDVLSQEEKRELLDVFGAPAGEFSTSHTIDGLFREQVAKTPDNEALNAVYTGDYSMFDLGGTSDNDDNGAYRGDVRCGLTYRELDRMVNRVAHNLVEKGVGPGQVVGILTERSHEMIIGLLGILRAGGAYVALNPQAPAERSSYTMEQCRSQLLLTTRPLSQTDNFQNMAKEWETIYIEDTVGPTQEPDQRGPIAPRATAGDLAYVVFTSGSTGVPKGVLITHANLSPYLFWCYREYRLDERDRMLQNASYYFDWSVKEIFLSLTCGAAVYMISRETLLTPEIMADFIDTHRITVFNGTPTQYGYLANLGRKLESLRYVFLGAERVTQEHAWRCFATLSEECRLYNVYGPTEGTIICSTFELKKEEMPNYQDLNTLLIGKSTGNSRLLVLDRHLNLCPPMVEGELHIISDSVSAGYINDPEKTAGVFIDCPFKGFEGRRMYKTGDRARLHHDGNLEFMGRLDFQVKIRGFRIEMGEIENRLLNHEAVAEAVVLDFDQPQGEKYLCAYVVLDAKSTLEDGDAGDILREHLTKYLPDYMIPSFFVFLDGMPLTPNGKVDRRALTKPDSSAIAGTGTTTPRNQTEDLLARLWADVLGIEKERIGIDNNFFQLGGHSLKATSMMARVEKELDVKLQLADVFRAPTIRDIADRIQQKTHAHFEAIAPLEKQDHYLLSSAQRRIFMLHQLESHGLGYNMPIAVTLEGDLKIDKLEDVFRRLVKRHESFRTAFRMEEGEAVQVVEEDVSFNMSHYEAQSPEQAHQLVKGFIRPFDLSGAPLLRVGLIRVENRKHILVVDMHHIISDGISVSVLVKEFMTLYSDGPLSPLPVQYKDFAQWQNRFFTTTALKEQEDWWLREYGDYIPILELPTDFSRPAIQDFSGRILGFKVGAAETAVLNQLASAEKSTLFMVLTALFQVFLAGVTNQEDIVVGVPIAGRRHADLENIIGMFVNSLPLRGRPEGHKTFLHFLREVRDHATEAFRNQDYPFEELVERVSAERDVSRNPIFDVMFAFNNVEISRAQLPGLTLIPYEMGSDISKFDLTLGAEEVEDYLLFSFEYCTKLFRESSIQRFVRIFQQLLSAVTVDPSLPLDRFALVSEDEKETILRDFNDTQMEYPTDITIHGMFEAQAARTPEHIAVTGVAVDLLGSGTVSLTYSRLNEIGDRLASRLREKGIRPGDVVGMMLPSSVEMVIAIIGILKSGAAWLPISPDYPGERIRYMLIDAAVRGLIALAPHVNQWQDVPGCGVLDMGEPRILAESVGDMDAADSQAVTAPGDAAYIIYTSGSTGNPKGVVVSHSSFVNRLHFMREHCAFTADDVILQKASPTFDVSVCEVFRGIVWGALLVIPGGEINTDLRRMAQLIKEHRVTVMEFVPSVLNLFLDYLDNHRLIAEAASLRIVFVGVEAVESEVVKRFRLLLHSAYGTRLINAYGPTEATVDVTWYDCTAGDGDTPDRIPIGTPIANSRAYILSKSRSLQPIGINGELCVSGSSLALGYLNQPELTAEKFIPNPFEETALHPSPLYKTGDLARWSADGNIGFYGRIDQQVKIRGYRIETGEIENRLLKHDSVSQTTVVVREDNSGDKYLCAYIVPTVLAAIEGDDVLTRLREYLSEGLPEYMIPAYMVLMDTIPLTPNGKVNEVLLPEPQEEGETYNPPRDSMDKDLLDIWCEVLGLIPDSVGIDHNFFRLGGQSLKATAMISIIHSRLKTKISLGELFQNPTIRQMADFIRDAAVHTYQAIVPVEKRDYYALSSAQRRLFIIQMLKPNTTGYNMPVVVVLEGKADREKMETCFRKLIHRHESFRTSFQMIDGESLQRIHDSVPFEMEYYDVCAVEPVEGQKAVELYVKDFIRPFEMTNAPLLRVGLLKEAEDRHILMMDMHHVISDGVSMGLLVNEFITLYREEPLAPLTLQYKDFALWQNRLFQSPVIEELETFWLDVFSGHLPVLQIPTDYTRPPVQSFEGGYASFVIPGPRVEALRRLVLNEGATLFMGLLSVFSTLLSKLSGQEDIIIGTPSAGRRHTEVEGIIGMFVNTLVLRTYPENNLTFRRFLGNLKRFTVSAFDHQDYQYEELVEKVGGQRDAGRNPLFDVLFSMQNLDDVDLERLNGEGAAGNGLAVKPFKTGERGVAKFDLTLVAQEVETELHCVFTYCTRLFKRETIERYITYFERLFSAFTGNPDRPLASIDILPEEERRRILVTFNDTALEYPAEKTIHQVFEEQVEKYPDAVAVVADGFRRLEKETVATRERDALAADKVYMTYRELNSEANRLALRLRDRGVTADTIVALMTPPSVETVIGLLAILKAGGGYMPMDPDSPVARASFILEDSGASLLLVVEQAVEKDLLSLLPTENNLALDEPPLFTGSTGNPELPCRPADLAYVIYTSGTTGRPKGVMVTNQNVVNLVTGLQTRIYHHYENLNRMLNISLVAPYVFDASVKQIFISLLRGHALHLVPYETRVDGAGLLEFYGRYGIDVSDGTPAHIRLMEEVLGSDPITVSIKHFLIGGEALTRETVSRFLKHFKDGGNEPPRITNVYGPTECTVDTTAFEVTQNNVDFYDEIPIGPPMPNYQVYILSKWNQVQPVGVLGELCIGGTGVARGYLNRPQLTAEKFVSSPFTHSPVYKTGDLARWLHDGTIQFAGRVDHQVKIRGYRIEPGEIEARILRHRQVKEAIVIDNTDDTGEKYLSAYVVPNVLPTAETAKAGPPEEEDVFPVDILPLKDLRLTDYLNENINADSSQPGTPFHIVQAFEALVREKGEAVAVKSGDRTLSYEALDRLTNQVANCVAGSYDQRTRLSKVERIRYKRHFLLDDWGIHGQEVLKETTLFVVGAGGIGSPIIQQLALLGIGKLIICDFDEVELSNLNRQVLHDDSRIGMNKALSAKMTVERINPHVKVETFLGRIDENNIDEVAGDSAVIFDCVDDLETKFVISRFAVRKGIPHILAAMIDINAYSSVLHAGHGPCFHCLHDVEKAEEIKEMRKVVKDYHKKPFPVASPPLFITTGFVCNEVVKYLLGFPNLAFNRFFLFNQKASESIVDTDGYRQMTFPFSQHFKKICESQGFDWEKVWRGKFVEELVTEKDPNCPLCSKKASVKPAVEGSAKTVKGEDIIDGPVDGNVDTNIDTNIDTNVDTNVNTNIDKKVDINDTQVVAILTSDPVDRAAAVLGILKSGKAYVQLDPTASEELLGVMLKESEARVLLTGPAYAELATTVRDMINKRIPVIDIAAIPSHANAANPGLAPETSAAASVRFKPDAFSGESFTITGLKDYLSRELPDYMIPSYFVLLEGLPLTSHGKVDRKALPSPEAAAVVEGYEAPRNDMETRLAGIWSEVLGVPQGKIGINSDFFELGGHSLKATRLVSRIHKEINAKVMLSQIFKSPTIRELGEHIGQSGTDLFDAIKPAEPMDFYPLSSAQKRIYVLQQMDLQSTGYNMTAAVILEGELDREKLENAFALLVERHESFRTSFNIRQQEPVQEIRETVDFKVEYHDADGNSDQLMKKFIRPFDLTRAPLLRVEVIREEAERHILMVDMHHSISDGVSMGVVVREFMALYNGQSLPPLTIQYKDFSQWQNRFFASPQIRKQEAWWLEQFSEELPVLQLPLDKKRPAIQSYEGHTVSFEIDASRTERLNRLAAQEESTFFMVLLSLYSLFLSKLSGQEDIVVGTPIAGRRHADLENIVGMFVNSLALRCRPLGETSFDLFLREVRDTTLEAYDNQDYPYEELVEKATFNRDTSRNPLFDTMLTLQNTDLPEIAIEGLNLKPYGNELRIAKFDITFSCQEVDQKLHCSLNYCTALFQEPSIKRFIRYFKAVVAAVADNPQVPMRRIDILSEEEKRELLEVFGAPAGEFPTSDTIDALFREQVAKAPNNEALNAVFAGDYSSADTVLYRDDVRYSLSYGQLDGMVNHLAHNLVGLGVGPGQMVGILADRSHEMIIGIMGILRAGGAYVPLNPEAPVERSVYTLDQCRSSLLVTTRPVSATGDIERLLEGRETVYIEDAVTGAQEPDPKGSVGDMAPRGNSGNLAYVIFTSGSTGVPKGVPITHANLSPILSWGFREYGIGEGDRIIQNLSYYFDWSVSEIVGSLTAGSALYMISKETLLNPEVMADFIDNHGITVLHATPTQYGYLANLGRKFESLRLLFVGAEKHSYDLAVRCFESISDECRFYNLYGPTEATIVASHLELKKEDMPNYRDLTSIPIGKTVGNTRLLVLDRYLNLCPPKVEGELYIAGDSLSTGYLNDPEKTAGVFVHCPFDGFEGSMMYKTGDRVRLLPDGNIEFLGRFDFQVKIRGFRIELGEIENRLSGHDDVAEVIVLALDRPDGEKYLCAYMVLTADAGVTEGEAETIFPEHLARHLPDYMIPDFFIIIDALPLTPNGKVDKRALPEPEASGIAGADFVAPRNDREKRLAEIWAGVLGIEKEGIGINSNFFQLGGHSLKATMLVSTIHKTFSVNIPLTQVFTHPTIRMMAQVLGETEETAFLDLEKTETRAFYPLSYNQQRIYILQQLAPQSPAYNIPERMLLERTMDVAGVKSVLEALMQRHESLRTAFKTVDDVPVQWISDNVEPPFEFADFSDFSEEEQQRKTSDFYARFAGTPFDLEVCPLFRAGLVKLGSEKYVFMFNLHHTIADGWSVEILKKEFMDMYGDVVEGKGIEYRELQYQYRDFASWHNRQLEDGEEAESPASLFWKKLLANGIPPLQLPADATNLPESEALKGAAYRNVVPGAVKDVLKGLEEQYQTSLFTLLYSVYMLLLSRVSGQEDIGCSIIVAGREHVALQEVVGLFVNSLLLKTRVDREEPFDVFLDRVNGDVMEAFQYQAYPMELVFEKMGMTFPEVSVSFNMLNMQDVTGGQRLSSHEPYHIEETQDIKFDIEAYITEYEDGIDIRWAYRKALFEPSTMEYFVGQYIKLLEFFANNPTKSLKDQKAGRKKGKKAKFKKK